MKPIEELFENYLKCREAVREALIPNYKSDWNQSDESLSDSSDDE